MNSPDWLKPGLYGAALGAVALAVFGFTWGGWMTGGSARQMAAEQAQLEVVAALLPVCLQQVEADPQSPETLATIKDASSYQRTSLVMKAGWATMPGATDPNRSVASACVESLSAAF